MIQDLIKGIVQLGGYAVQKSISRSCSCYNYRSEVKKSLVESDSHVESLTTDENSFESRGIYTVYSKVQSSYLVFM